MAGFRILLYIVSNVAELRENVVQGEIQDGEQLRQGGRNRARIRGKPHSRSGSLRQLEVEGLITIVPHRGAVVSLLSGGKSEELFEIRDIPEPEVLRASIPNLKASDFETSEQILETYDAAPL